MQEIFSGKTLQRGCAGTPECRQPHTGGAAQGAGGRRTPADTRKKQLTSGPPLSPRPASVPPGSKGEADTDNISQRAPRQVRPQGSGKRSSAAAADHASIVRRPCKHRPQTMQASSADRASIVRGPCKRPANGRRAPPPTRTAIPLPPFTFPHNALSVSGLRRDDFSLSSGGLIQARFLENKNLQGPIYYFLMTVC